MQLQSKLYTIFIQLQSKLFLKYFKYFKIIRKILNAPIIDGEHTLMYGNYDESYHS